MITVDIDKLNPLYCKMHDAEYKWDGTFIEKKCKDEECEFCQTRPKKISDTRCKYCAIKESCISWNARKLKKEDSQSTGKVKA